MPVIDYKADLKQAVGVISELLLAQSKEGGEIDRRLSRIDALKFVELMDKVHGIR